MIFEKKSHLDQFHSKPSVCFACNPRTPKTCPVWKGNLMHLQAVHLGQRVQTVQADLDRKHFAVTFSQFSVFSETILSHCSFGFC